MADYCLKAFTLLYILIIYHIQYRKETWTVPIIKWAKLYKNKRDCVAIENKNKKTTSKFMKSIIYRNELYYFLGL